VVVPQPRPKLNDVLAQAAAYVRRFENDFAAIITDETYDQRVVEGASRAFAPASRRIRSEMLFMRLPEQGLSWLSVRNVLEVDGAPIADSHDRLESAIKGDPTGLVSRLRSVADEGARFNLGGIRRNFNDPILPLLFLDREYQSRFKFQFGEEEDANEVRARRILFRETTRPIVIKEVGGSNIFTSGVLWVRAEDGVVVRTELSAASEVSGTSLRIHVDYHRDAKLEMWIPARMVEHYRHKDTAEEVDCVAVYSNARRFETSGRVIVK
jgi:hypothetical protein